MQDLKITYDQIERYASWSKIYVAIVQKNRESIVEILTKCIEAGQILPEYKDSPVSQLFSITKEGIEEDKREIVQSAKYANVLPHTADKFEIGAILLKIWGHDETHNDFFCIVEMSNKSVKLLPLERIVAESATHHMIGTARPGNEILFRKKAIAKRRQMSSYEPKEYVSMDNRRNAYLWDGMDQRETWYA